MADTFSPRSRPFPTDKVGIFLSVLCAIHCVATPFLFLLAPAFGGIWAHPASHWIGALAVVPLAGISTFQGFSRHRKRMVALLGSLGIVLIITGAALPYIERNQKEKAQPVASSAEEEPFVFVVGEDSAEIDKAPNSEAQCVDSCCPSLQTDQHGNTKLHIPPASIVTTLGGIALIVTHIGNLCGCVVCNDRRKIM